MVLMEWDDRLSVGVASIDDQHKQLIKLVNTLYQALQNGQGNEVLRQTYADLVDYTLTHFSHEEAMMREAGYPGTADHCRQHADLRLRTLQLQDKAGGGGIAISIATMQFLKDWLFHHICGTDRQFGDFLLAQKKD